MEHYRQAVVRSLKEHLELSEKLIDEMIEVPPNPKMGDFAFPCFPLSKAYRKSPVDIAASLFANLKESKHIGQGKLITEVKAEGPYLNFYLDKSSFAKDVLQKIYDEGPLKLSHSKGETLSIMVEGWQPNTHKAFHIGHIRNTVLGESICRVLEAYGHKVIRASYMGDIGAHVAKWLWYYNKFYKGEIPTENVSKWAGEIYNQATLKIEENSAYEDEVHEVHRLLEDGDQKLVEQWKKTRELCLQDFEVIFRELGSRIDREYFESEVEQPGKQMVKELLAKDVAKLDQGAIIINLEQYKLGIFLLLKSNGASLYSTKDIALAYLKSKEYNFDRSLYIVASEQEHHFRQLFKTLEIMGYPKWQNLHHLSYGLVKLAEGKMSSRLGNIILYEDFKKQLMDKVAGIIEKQDISESERKSIIKAVAFGAMKYTMLSQDPQKEIIFNFDQALSFEGESGPYIQYTHARLCSILAKYDGKLTADIDYHLLNGDSEKNLIRLFSQWHSVVKSAADHFKPSVVAKYLIELSQATNEFYHNVPVLKSTPEEMRARILLIKCAKDLISQGLFLLSIDAPESM